MPDTYTDYNKPDEHRIYEAIQAAKQPDPPGYRGETTREYQKELGRQILVRGRNNAIGSHEARTATDQDIAARLLAASHKAESIQNSLTHASPQTNTKYWQKRSHVYASNVVASVLENEQAMARIQEVQRHAVREGIGKERRLEHVEKLATPMNRMSQQKAIDNQERQQ